MTLIDWVVLGASSLWMAHVVVRKDPDTANTRRLAAGCFLLLVSIWAFLNVIAETWATR